MKKIILIGLALVLVALGLSARWWLPQLLSFAGTNGNAIQSVTSLLQLLIWAGAAIAAIAGWVSPRKPDAGAGAVSNFPATNVNVGGAGSVGIGGAVSNSTVITGDGVNATGNRSVAIGEGLSGKVFTGDIEEYNEIRQEAPRPIVTSLRQLPSPPQDFIDRETELAELIKQSENGVTIYVLQGLGGVGKSALAFKLAEALSRHYEDGQLYLDLKGTSKPPLSVDQIMTHVILSYNLTSELPTTEEGLRGLYRSVLNGKRALLFMDNAAHDEQVVPLLQSNCAMVITSRQSLVLPKMYAMSLNTLSPKDARELLKKITSRINEEQAGTIAELCGNLPLALRLAGSAIEKRRNLSVADYAQRLRDASERLDLVEASLSLSYDLLNKEQQRLFCALAVFPQTFDSKAVEALWEMQTNPAQDALGDLLNFSLVELNEATSRYRLQELVRIFADAHLSGEERDAHRRRHALHYLGVLRQAGELYFRSVKESKEGLNLFDVEWANIQASQQWAKEHIVEDKVSNAVAGIYTYAGAYLLALRRPPKERLDWHKVVIAAAEHAQKPGVKGSNLCFMGVAHRDLAEYDEVITVCQQALALAVQEKDSREESNALSYTGIAYYYKSQYRIAIDFCQQALDITRQILDKQSELKQLVDKRSEIEQLRYLGHARRGVGQFEEAVEHYQQSLEAARQLDDLNGENAVLGALGRIYCDMGKQEEAIKKYLPDAVRLAQEIGDRRGECINLAHLGLAHRDMGQYEEARNYYEQALLIAADVDAPSTEAYSLGGLGKIHLALGQPQDALKKATAALELATQIGMKRAQQHWGTALAQVYLHMNDLPKALEVADAALSCDSVWNNHRTSALKGLSLARMGQAQPARLAFEKASEYARHVLEETPGYFDARYTLGLSSCGMALTATDERAALIAQAQAAYRDAYSNCSAPGVIRDALSMLDELLRVGGAEEELRAARDFLEQLMPPGNRAIAETD